MKAVEQKNAKGAKGGTPSLAGHPWEKVTKLHSTFLGVFPRKKGKNKKVNKKVGVTFQR